MLNLNAKPQISIQVEKEGKLKDISKPREDANCLNCYIRNSCGMFNNKKYNENGKPPVACYGYEKQMTEEDINSTWGNTK
ncbi:MAG TPA: hypothetical protein VIL29_04765 [Pseudothermotoga sp.]